MLKFRRVKQLAFLFQIGKDHGIGLLDKHSAISGIVCHLTFGIDQLYKGKIVIASDTGVVLTESRSNVYDTGTVSHGNVTVAGHEMCFLALFCSNLTCNGKQRLILFVFQIFSGIGFQHFICFFTLLGQLAENLIRQSLGQIIYISVNGFYLNIGLLRVYTECHVAGQCPGSGGPCQEISILSDDLKPNYSGTLFHQLVALSHLMGGQRSTAARAVGNDFEAFVEQSFVPDFFQCPPFGLDKIVIIGYVGIIHICPETNSTGEVLPHTLVFPYRLFTFGDKRIKTILFDLFLTVQPQKFLYFQLHRQSVGIPSGFTGNHIPFHGAVTRDHILNYTCQHMTDMGFTVCGRRSVIEGIGGAFFTVFHTFTENVIVFPEFLDLLFSLYEVEVCRYFLIHLCTSFIFRICSEPSQIHIFLKKKKPPPVKGRKHQKQS